MTRPARPPSEVVLGVDPHLLTMCTCVTFAPFSCNPRTASPSHSIDLVQYASTISVSPRRGLSCA
eukprot:scaffold137684_cov133-Phaeocystis_antarctica.AAC.1